MPDVIGTLFHKEIPYGGVKGDKGDTGATPNVSATASVDSSTGTPSVNVVKTGTAENPSFEFAFSNLKGEKGDPGSGSSVSWGEIDGDIADQTDLSTELAKKYDENDTAETDIDDADYFPFYDTSDTGKRKSLWSNIKAKLKAYFDGIYTLLTIVGTVESGTTASKAYAIGQHFIKDGYFCTAIAAIAQGATLTLNTNYTQGDIAGAIESGMDSRTRDVHYDIDAAAASTFAEFLSVFLDVIKYPNVANFSASGTVRWRSHASYLITFANFSTSSSSTTYLALYVADTMYFATVSVAIATGVATKKAYKYDGTVFPL